MSVSIHSAVNMKNIRFGRTNRICSLKIKFTMLQSSNAYGIQLLPIRTCVPEILLQLGNCKQIEIFCRIRGSFHKSVAHF
jgi:hypothetical protein